MNQETIDALYSLTKECQCAQDSLWQLGDVVYRFMLTKNTRDLLPEIDDFANQTFFDITTLIYTLDRLARRAEQVRKGQ